MFHYIDAEIETKSSILIIRCDDVEFYISGIWKKLLKLL